ncbi:hypothetical protein U0070_014291, partial [Myodes glareolus]
TSWEETETHQQYKMEPVNIEDVAVNSASEEWAVLDSSQKNLYRDKKTLEENIEEDYKDLSRNMEIQRTEKDHVNECHNECDKNQQPIPESMINKDMPSRVRAHETPLLATNILVIYPYMGISEKKVEGNHHCISELWQKILNIRNIGKISVFETSPEEKPREKNNNEMKPIGVCFDQPQERTHTGDKLTEDVFMRCTHGQNDEENHKEAKQSVCSLSEGFLIDSSELTNHEKSHIEEKRYICRQCGKTFKYATCFEKQKVTHKGEKPYASIHLEKPSPNSIIVTVIKAVTLDKSPMLVSIVEKISPVLLIETFIKSHTGE